MTIIENFLSENVYIIKKINQYKNYKSPKINNLFKLKIIYFILYVVVI